MAFDIYGKNLRENHCEVHPWVHETYPCTICFQEGELQKRKNRKQEPIDNRLHPDDPLNSFPSLSDWLQHIGCYGAGQSMEQWGKIVSWCRDAAQSLQEIVSLDGGWSNDAYARAEKIIERASDDQQRK